MQSSFAFVRSIVGALVIFVSLPGCLTVPVEDRDLLEGADKDGAPLNVLLKIEDVDRAVAVEDLNLQSELAGLQVMGSRYVRDVVEELSNKLSDVDVAEELRSAAFSERVLGAFSNNYELVDQAFTEVDSEREWITIDGGVVALVRRMTVFIDISRSERRFKPSSLGGRWITVPTHGRQIGCRFEVPEDDLPPRRTGRPLDQRLGDYWRDLSAEQVETMFYTALDRITEMYQYLEANEIDLVGMDQRTMWEKANMVSSYTTINGVRWEYGGVRWVCILPFPELPESRTRGI